MSNPLCYPYFEVTLKVSIINFRLKIKIKTFLLEYFLCIYISIVYTVKCHLNVVKGLLH